MAPVLLCSITTQCRPPALASSPERPFYTCQLHCSAASGHEAGVHRSRTTMLCVLWQAVAVHFNFSYAAGGMGPGVGFCPRSLACFAAHCRHWGCTPNVTVRRTVNSDTGFTSPQVQHLSSAGGAATSPSEEPAPAACSSASLFILIGDAGLTGSLQAIFVARIQAELLPGLCLSTDDARLCRRVFEALAGARGLRSPASGQQVWPHFTHCCTVQRGGG